MIKKSKTIALFENIIKNGKLTNNELIKYIDIALEYISKNLRETYMPDKKEIFDIIKKDISNINIDDPYVLEIYDTVVIDIIVEIKKEDREIIDYLLDLRLEYMNGKRKDNN